MSALTVNTDAYSRLRVPGANAARLVDEWADSCASSEDEFESKALLVEVDKIRRYLHLADKDVRHSGARSKRDADSRPSSAERDYRDLLMMAIGTIDVIEGISNWHCGGGSSSPSSTASRFAAGVRKALLQMVDAVDGFEGPTLTENERGWLEEYVRQLLKRFPEQIEDVMVCSPDHDPELRTLVLISEGDRATEKEVSTLGHMIDMSGFFAGPLIRVLTVAEWDRRKLTGATAFFNGGEREGVSVL